MEIRSLSPDEHTEFLALVDAEIRPAGATTRAADDFPVALAPGNRAGQLVAVEDGQLVGCLVYLLRRFRTTWGPIPVAGIGSVVTRPDWRGRGISSALQDAALSGLRRQEVPLAVLWTSRPEIYAGRGFRQAGLEFHVDLARAQLTTEAPPWVEILPYTPALATRVEQIYLDHDLVTLRGRGDAELLYGMPGTRGLVARDGDGIVLAYLFCGKGADFAGYALEWGGERPLVIALLAHAVRRGLARRVLVPCGSEDLVDRLVDQGAGWFAHPSGCWSVIDPALLAARGDASGWRLPAHADPLDPRTWLGRVDADGTFEAGPLGVAVWGFDSV
jgi:predicted N-acetyltransferase YhbS